MISKKNHPKIEPKGWVTVEGSECVVTQIYSEYCLLGACEVVANPNEPINRDVCWDGQQWVFSERPCFFNATGTSRLKEFVVILLQSQDRKIDCQEVALTA